MTIIRGETVNTIALLTSAGELIFSEKEGFGDLVEEECRKSFQKGQESGEKIGYHRALEESKIYVELLQTVTRKVLDQKNRLLDQLKPEIIEFAIAVCERVIRKELSQPHVFVRLINTLLTAAIPQLNGDTLRIFLAPEDYSMLESSFDQIQYNVEEIKGIRFVSDSLMRQGDCRIETSSGLLNYDISRELADLQAKVLQR